MENEKALPLPISFLTSRLIFFGLAGLSFAAPFAFSHSQFFTGTMVNAALFLSAVLLPGRLFSPIIVLPSLGALSRGVIFGPFTPFLVYFLPFIWLGNLSLVLVFKKTLPKVGFGWGVILAALGKFLLLFSSANGFFRWHLVPRLFLQTMGVNQLLTALMGGLLVWLVLKPTCHGRI